MILEMLPEFHAYIRTGIPAALGMKLRNLLKTNPNPPRNPDPLSCSKVNAFIRQP